MNSSPDKALEEQLNEMRYDPVKFASSLKFDISKNESVMIKTIWRTIERGKLIIICHGRLN